MGSKAKTEEDKQKFENEQFGDVFEEMLREEGMAEDGGKPTGKFWSMVGGLSGGAMGFIVANFPGMLAGAVAGNRLGAIRDTKGKSVYSVFQVCISGEIIRDRATNINRNCRRAIRPVYLVSSRLRSSVMR